MKNTIFIAITFSCCILFASENLFAQSSGLFGSRNSTSQSNDRSRTFNGNTTGTDALNLQGSELIDRNSRQAGDIAGGRTADDAANFVGANNGNQQGGRVNSIDNLTNAINDANAFNRQQTGQNQNNRRKYRMRVVVAFKYPKHQPLGSQSRFASPLSKTLKRVAGGQVQISMNARTAILRGTVATNHERMMAEKLAMLEPGVSAVKNELTVKPDSVQAPPSN